MKHGNEGFNPKGAGFGGGAGFGVSGSGFNVGGSDLPDPLANVDYTGNVGVDAARELTALQEGMKARAKAERKRHAAAVDTEFWFAVYFADREEKENFLKAAGVVVAMMGDKYIDGRKLAQVLKIEYEHGE